MEASREQILFFLNRHFSRATILTKFDHEAAAKRGMPYDQRQKMIEATKEIELEVACFKAAITIVEQFKFDEQNDSEQP